MTDYDKLRELAQNATPGPWKLAGGNEWLSPLGLDVGSEDECSHPTLRHRDAEFIAAANPAAVLNLLDELQAAKADAGCNTEAKLTQKADLLEEVAREQEDVALYGLMLAEAARLRATIQAGNADAG